MSKSRNRNRRPRSTDARAVTGTAGQFTFTHRGRQYILPPASKAPGRMQAGVLIDSIKDTTGAGDARLGIAMLEAVEPDPDVMAALREMTVEQFNRTIGRWMAASGADLGKSEGSST